MRKLFVAVVLGTVLWMFGPRLDVRAAHAYEELDYYGENLFLGLAYHRWACAESTTTIQSNNTYQGFTGTQHCVAGQPWNSIAYDTYLGWTETDTRGHTEASGWDGYFYGYANWDYGLSLSFANTSTISSFDKVTPSPSDWHYYSNSWFTGYADNSTWNINSRSTSGAPNSCSYNVLTNCNSDCWIRDFSSREGWTVSIASPCW